MRSLRELYRIGRGPSSSHTMGPETAAKRFLSLFPGSDYRVTLRGSLAKTGRGHCTDAAILGVLPGAGLIFDTDTPESALPHPNTLDFEAFKDGKKLGERRALSVGGGAVSFVGDSPEETSPEPYPHRSFAEISSYCSGFGLRLPDYVRKFEGGEIFDYLREVWRAMRAAVERGLAASGTLPGGLGIKRRAGYMYNTSRPCETEPMREARLISAYAFAVGEENASGGTIVTAPTCGACGVLPAVLYYLSDHVGYGEDDILRALAAAGLIGDVIKTNASIPGAECGCQAEIGSACSMTAAAVAELHGLELGGVEYSAEVAMEHQLGLTCDSVCGLVQIPCIERNAVAATRALDSENIASLLYTTRKISFDSVVRTMYETGRDILSAYRETSIGGLAKLYAGDAADRR